MKLINSVDFRPSELFDHVEKLKNRRGNPAGKKRHYMKLTTAFDIETSYLPDIEQSVMYIWQWAFGEDLVVVGRTWDDFIRTRDAVRKCLPEDHWLVVYVHNLSFEFQFLKGIYHFLPDDVFAIASRKILKCDMSGAFEFRCSYKLTNMSLSQFTRKFKVQHQKLSGEDFNYSETRYPWTVLTAEQVRYCVNDVLGLVEAVNALMSRDGDTLQTIPMTSTGYVRREAKRAMRSEHHEFVYSILPDYDLYKALREAFRGGNTHANRYYTDEIIHNVHSADRSSSYPAVICNCEFPMSVFISIMKHDLNLGYIRRCIRIRHKALLLRIGIKKLRLRNPFDGCPYLSKDKCRNIIKAKETEDNGRILLADYLETTVTDIDLQIILKQYRGNIIFLQGWYSSYKPLPKAFTDLVISYYRDKTTLKGVPGQEAYYDKAKALLNSLYGMMAQDPVKDKQIFQQIGDYVTSIGLIEDEYRDGAITESEMLERIRKIEYDLLMANNKKAFLAYQWGVWVTAHSRKALQDGIDLVSRTSGAEFIYCDTDSVKYTGTVDWSDYNARRVSECKASGAYATDPGGTTHYMGVFETEDNPQTGVAYAEFKTLGAKKYAYRETPEGETHCTIAGVNKKKGGSELDKHGGLQAFNDGFVFREAGGTEAIYQDNPAISAVEIDGHVLPITSNVSILPSEYTLGITGEYARIIRYAKSYLYNPYII